MTVTVKKLVWGRSEDGFGRSAQSVVGKYWYWRGNLFVPGASRGQLSADPESDAQRHYEALIMSALEEPAP